MNSAAYVKKSKSSFMIKSAGPSAIRSIYFSLISPGFVFVFHTAEKKT
jgi:hypothetical protein